MVTQITGFKDRLLAPNNGLKVSWFEQWNSSLDEALQTLPEMDNCPHELYRLLLQNPASVLKRTALVTERGTPVAVVGLRQKSRSSWELLTQWIIPGAIFPAQPEYLIPALEALGTEVWVAWWRVGAPPPPGRWIRSMRCTPTYRMHLTEDYEAYWRENKYYKTIRNKRNRCLDFKLVVNSPGSAEWTIKNWESKWRADPHIVDPALTDRIVAAQYLENHGRHFTLWLLDQDIPIGGATLTAHNDDLVAGVIYREPEYEWHGVGVRLIDLSFSFAAENGFKLLDIGGGQDYKKHWAPHEGEHWLFNVCPEALFRAKQTMNWARMFQGKVTNWARSSQRVEY
jgi:GNAT superfamily N-acetyltransferase